MGKSLAARLNDFYKEFDFYDYMDVVVVSDESATIAALEQQLQDSGLTHGILTALTHFREEVELSGEQVSALDGLINDVGLHEAKILIDDFSRREFEDLIYVSDEELAPFYEEGSAEESIEPGML